MNASILIVDDTPATSLLLTDILTAAGYEVRQLDNGELALRSAQAHAPDLLLLDVRMAGMNGFEVCQRLKQTAGLDDIPVILLSAADDVHEKVRGFQVGAVDYITKPFHKEEVLARVRTHVELHHSRRTLRQTAEALRRSEESLKIAQSIAHLGYWEWDMENSEMRWSDETYHLLGYAPGQFEPSREALFAAVHAEDREALLKQIDETREGHSFDIEHRVVLPDGRVRVLHCVGELLSLGEREPRVIAAIRDVTDHPRHKLLGVIQDITERKEMERRLELEAHTDSLTGCATRRHFLDLVRQEMARVRRYGHSLSVVMLDLNDFKAINDRYGHGIGDLALQTFVRVCRETLREEDVVGRLGGDEFAVLLPETSATKAAEVGQRLCRVLAAVEIDSDRGLLQVTVSIGVATLAPDDAAIETLLERADQAMYAAKRGGRSPPHADSVDRTAGV